MKHVAVWVWITTVFLPTVFLPTVFLPPNGYADRPVLVEVFHSSQDCPSCPLALDAVRQVQTEFPASSLHLLSFPVRDTLQIAAGFIRYRLGYLEPPLPTVMFDGSNRISGADNRVANAYRRQIEFQLSQPRNGRMFSFKEQVADAWISRVTFSLPNGVPEGGWELFAAAATPIQSSPSGGVLLNVVQWIESVPLNDTVTEDGWIAATLPVTADDAAIFWFIQKRNAFTRALDEVLLTSRASDELLSPADFSFDGIINHEDVLIFAALWNLLDPQADLNRDGEVDQRDVLLFHQTVSSNRLSLR